MSLYRDNMTPLFLPHWCNITHHRLAPWLSNHYHSKIKEPIACKVPTNTKLKEDIILLDWKLKENQTVIIYNSRSLYLSVLPSHKINWGHYFFCESKTSVLTSVQPCGKKLLKNCKRLFWYNSWYINLVRYIMENYF